jgi:hypothetical protein
MRAVALLPASFSRGGWTRSTKSYGDSGYLDSAVLINEILNDARAHR